MKKYIVGLTVISLIVGSLLGGFVYNSSASADVVDNSKMKVAQEPRKVIVNGKGIISAKPDVAYIRLGVYTMNKDVEKSQNENASRVDKVIKALVAAGIKKEEIATNSFSIDQRYDYKNNGERVLVGYEVRNMVTVTVNDMKRVGKVINTSVAAGGNQIDGISFDIKDKKSLQEKALKLAMKDAKSKAAVVMSEFGKKPEVPFKVTVVGQNYGIMRDEIATEDMNMKSAGRVETPIFAGSQEVIANVVVEYSY